MTNLPFSVQNIYLPESCNARQIESVTKARIIQTTIYIGDDFPYLYIATYKHIQALESTQRNKPSSKWLPIPEKYNLPCLLDEDIKNHKYLLIPSGQELLYWRCKTREFLDEIQSQGASWQLNKHVG